VLGNVLSINKLVSKAVEYSDNNQTVDMMRIFGQMTYILLDFEPIVLDEAGLDGEIYLQNDAPVNKSLEGARDIVKKWHKEIDDYLMSKEELEYKYDASRPIVKQSLDDLNGVDISNWFGILDFAPGL
jgi:hypothetical protein